MIAQPWLRAFLDPQVGPLLWVALSVAIYTLGAHLVWATRWVRDAWPLALRQVPWLAGAFQAVRLVYYVVVPYLALVWGVLTPDSLGLTLPESPAIFRQTAIAGAILAMVLATAWAHYARRGWIASPPNAQPWPDSLPTFALPFGWAIVLREAVFAQAHWAFYRAGLASLLEVGDLSIWLALALILLESYLNPRVRLDLHIPGRAEPILLTAQLALVTTALFILSRSTWLTLVVHATLAAAIPWWVHWIRASQRRNDLLGD